MKILVAGFEPFGEDIVNPASEVLQLLPKTIQTHKIDTLEIPTTFNESSKVLEQEMKRYQYDVVLVIGQAGGRFEITPERIGINLDDARIPDNNGKQPIDERIQEGGASAYFSNLPVKRITKAIRDVGIPARLSHSAGTFVCNHILYQLGYMHEQYFPNLKFGFIHIPYIPEQVIQKGETPSMFLDLIAKGLITALEVIVSYEDDIKSALGEIH